METRIIKKEGGAKVSGPGDKNKKKDKKKKELEKKKADQKREIAKSIRTDEVKQIKKSTHEKTGEKIEKEAKKKQSLVDKARSKKGVPGEKSIKKPGQADHSLRGEKITQGEIKKSYADQAKIYRPGISDQQQSLKKGTLQKEQAEINKKQEKPEVQQPQERTSGKIDQQKSYTDQDKVYRPETSDQQQSLKKGARQNEQAEINKKPGKPGDQHLQEKTSGKTDQQKSYADQDKVYRPGISDQPLQSRPGDKQKESRPKDRSEPAKTEYTRTPEEEKKERQKVHHPPDGVGFKFNSSKLEPAAIKHLDKIIQQKKEALMDPNVTVTLEGHTSRPGKELYNWGKSMDRTNSVYDYFEKKGVRANILLYGEGEDAAIKKEKPENADYAEDRVVRIKIERPQKLEKEKPEKPKTDVPEKYKKGYKRDRKYAENKADRNVWDIAKDSGIPKVTSPKWLAKQILKGGKEMINASDFLRWCKETPWDMPPDQKLWKVTPPRGIAGDLQNDRTFQRRIKPILKQGGYDPEKMYKEYLIHWIRKGAK